MPLELTRTKAVAPIGARLIPASRGWAEVHPKYREAFAAARLMTAESLLALPGEVVSGHPDRHVVRVELPGGTVGYLKKQHRTGRLEKLKSPRCVREAKVLKQLAAKGFPCPQWVAFGEDGDGRAFLLVEDLKGGRELRSLLSDSALSLVERQRLAERIGQSIAELHAAGFGTPDLSAKHVFVDPSACTVTLIDWQNSRSDRHDPKPLAALDASLAAGLASPRERLRMLWAYTRVCRTSGVKLPRFSELVRKLQAESDRIGDRRSLRDQREAVNADQRLVWLADEAVCAIPEIAAIWPKPAVAPPFYSCPGGTISIQLADGRAAKLIRGRNFAPLGRLIAWLRGKSWRAPGMAIARELFQRERYGQPGPKLYAFGQRLTGRATAEWFVLHSVDDR
ncbi:MAG: lipopolysaccharide kinase InaA family protein [Gemmataceae bacterium]